MIGCVVPCDKMRRSEERKNINLDVGRRIIHALLVHANEHRYCEIGSYDKNHLF